LKEENMPDLVAVVFSSETKADEVRQELLAMAKEYLIEIGDAVVAVKTDNGRVKLNQMLNTTAAGAAGGSFWGLLVGFIFMNPLLGVAAGAASGALAGRLTDIGINDDFMKKLAEDVAMGEAILFVLVNRMTGDKVLKRLEGVGGRVLQTSLDTEAENKLRAALAEHRAAG
jgi:uncharacterized membrane protein